MTAFQTLALLLGLAAAGAYLNYRFLRLPSMVGLMMFALLLSFLTMGGRALGLMDYSPIINLVAHIDFSNILLHGMLCFLLFAGALNVNFQDLRRHQGIILVLATFGTTVAAFAAGTLVWFLASALGITLPYIYALIFGALIAPTDAVAVLGILKTVGVSKALRVKISCESLLNDGVGVVLFLLLLGVAQHPNETISANEVMRVLAWQGLGAIVFGFLLGWVGQHLLGHIDDYKVEVLMTLALAVCGYVLAEQLDVSAPITMVIGGLVVGNHSQMFGVAHRYRKHVNMFWELLDEVINAVLFILMGFEMMVVSISPLMALFGLLATGAILLARCASVSLPVALLSPFYKFEKGTIALLTWGGMRGGISIAMALSLPAVAEKDLILSLTYVTVVFSVLFQGTSFHLLASRYGYRHVEMPKDGFTTEPRKPKKAA
ncbi:MAG: sodium:proton antiporter [Alphaproteobacteria bacterium]|nr:sodium:proton antiporter [Alphaproteobacteria bacterium]MBV8548253.1 sodium:proton antiporter [Alphaproteobacteria bacterium]